MSVILVLSPYYINWHYKIRIKTTDISIMVSIPMIHTSNELSIHGKGNANYISRFFPFFAVNSWVIYSGILDYKIVSHPFMLWSNICIIVYALFSARRIVKQLYYTIKVVFQGCLLISKLYLWMQNSLRDWCIIIQWLKVNLNCVCWFKSNFLSQLLNSVNNLRVTTPSNKIIRFSLT